MSQHPHRPAGAECEPHNPAAGTDRMHGCPAPAGITWGDLLGRSARTSPVSPETIAGKRILITGAGGSIGSALALHLAGMDPAALTLLESSELALYELDQALLTLPIHPPHHPVLASVGDHAAIDELFAGRRPEIVFHAAALKHVPLTENNPFAAIGTNVFGTEVLLDAAARFQCSSVVVVSTDKAAAPVSWMGASKRIAELLALTLSSPSLQCAAVRLGNVLGSSGSVVPRFCRQIAAGGPVTVTHPQAARFFLTIEETVDALLQAAAPACRGGLLAANPGEPIAIAELAQRLLTHTAAHSVPIVYTGLRPGDKMSETLLSATESYTGRTCGDLLEVATPLPSPQQLSAGLQALHEAYDRRAPAALLQAVQALVPEYQPSASLLERLNSPPLDWMPA